MKLALFIYVWYGPRIHINFAVFCRYQYIIYVNASENLTLSESTGETDDYRQVGVSIQYNIVRTVNWKQSGVVSIMLLFVQKGELNLEFNSGAVYLIVVTENRGNDSSLVEEGEQYKVTGVEIDEPNSVSIFLQVPMYVIITAGEVMFSITGLEFAYSQVRD